MSGLFFWLPLGLVAFAMVTGVLYTLAMQYRQAVRVHDLVRDTRQMRSEYLRKRAAGKASS